MTETSYRDQLRQAKNLIGMRARDLQQARGLEIAPPIMTVAPSLERHVAPPRLTPAVRRFLALLVFMIGAALGAMLPAGCAFQHGSAVELGSDAGSAATPNGLTQVDDNATEPGDSVYCQGPTGTLDNAWFRVFAPGPVHVDYAVFATEAVLGDDATVIVYSYAGEVGGDVLDFSQMGQLATFPVSGGTYPAVQGFGVAIDMDLTEPFAICVVSTDAVAADGTASAYFHLAGNSGGESAPSYWQSHACGQDRPIATGPALLIGAQGRPL